MKVARTECVSPGRAAPGGPPAGLRDCYSQSAVRYPRGTTGCVAPLTLLAAAWLIGQPVAGAQIAADPFAFFQPQATLGTEERMRLDAGDIVVKTVDATSRDVGVFAAARLDTGGDRLVSWVRRIDALKRGRQVAAIARFSQPPRLEDLAGLELDSSDVDALRRCVPGDCGLKLDESDQRALAAIARERATGWEAAVQHGFRAALLARTETYLNRGMAGVAAYRDAEISRPPTQEFDALLAASPFLTRNLPGHVDALQQFPAAAGAGVESFLYWSKESLGGKPIVSITHVTISRHADDALPDAIVLARQVYASHYMTAALAVTAVVGGRGGAPTYLAYLNRSRLDVLDGMFAGIARRIIERRLRNEAGQVIDVLRRRLQSGEP